MRPNPHLGFLLKCIRGGFKIPQFEPFANEVVAIFKDCKEAKRGSIADYIPELANAPEDDWGVAVCTVEGQRVKVGDSEKVFSLQSCALPINYAIAMQEAGPDVVHGHVG